MAFECIKICQGGLTEKIGKKNRVTRKSSGQSIRVASDAIEEEISFEDVLILIKEAISDKKGEDIVFLDLSLIVDYLDVICIATGHTPTHNRAIADSVTEKLAEYGIISDSLQGYSDGSWILLDYGLIVVHIMLPHIRVFYDLEELWAEGERVDG